MNYNRRKFIKGMAVASAAIPFSGVLASTQISRESSKYPISFFTKPLDKFGADFLVETLRMAGLDGLDLTVRPKGIVLPEEVADNLPKMVELAHKTGLEAELMVTNINKADAPLAREVLAIAAENGIKHYRLAYYSYNEKAGVWGSLPHIKKDMQKLAELNKELGIQGGYQNHTGTRFGAPLWDLWEVLRDIPVDRMSSQYDIRHAVCEGSNAWLLSLNLLSEKIGSLAIKDFTWDISGGSAKVKSVPLGEGIIDFDEYFKTLKTLGIVAPISLHTEYPLLTSEQDGLTLLQKQKILVKKLKKDVDFIRKNLKKHQLS